MITVFTPTYNRAYIIPKLYESLKRQTVKDFEWLVVDDGSTDNTSELLAEWTKENDFPVRYIWQPNGGKPRAITKALAEAKGEWFFIVDSDDFISDDAIETIIRYAPECTGKTGIIVRPVSDGHPCSRRGRGPLSPKGGAQKWQKQAKSTK